MNINSEDLLFEKTDINDFFKFTKKYHNCAPEDVDDEDSAYNLIANYVENKHSKETVWIDVLRRRVRLYIHYYNNIWKTKKSFNLNENNHHIQSLIDALIQSDKEYKLFLARKNFKTKNFFSDRNIITSILLYSLVSRFNPSIANISDDKKLDFDQTIILFKENGKRYLDKNYQDKLLLYYDDYYSKNKYEFDILIEEEVGYYFDYINNLLEKEFNKFKINENDFKELEEKVINFIKFHPHQDGFNDDDMLFNYESGGQILEWTIDILYLPIFSANIHTYSLFKVESLILKLFEKIGYEWFSDINEGDLFYFHNYLQDMKKNIISNVNNITFENTTIDYVLFSDQQDMNLILNECNEESFSYKNCNKLDENYDYWSSMLALDDKVKSTLAKNVTNRILKLKKEIQCKSKLNNKNTINNNEHNEILNYFFKKNSR